MIQILKFSCRQTDSVNHMSSHIMLQVFFAAKDIPKRRGILMHTGLLFVSILAFINSISFVLSTYPELFIL